MKKSLILLSLVLVVLTGCGFTSEWDAASVAEIQAVTSQSNCAKKVLLDANRDGVEITRRSLNKVKDRCVSVDEQAKAF